MKINVFMLVQRQTTFLEMTEVSICTTLKLQSSSLRMFLSSLIVSLNARIRFFSLILKDEMTWWAVQALIPDSCCRIRWDQSFPPRTKRNPRSHSLITLITPCTALVHFGKELLKQGLDVAVFSYLRKKNDAEKCFTLMHYNQIAHKKRVEIPSEVARLPVYLR